MILIVKMLMEEKIFGSSCFELFSVVDGKYWFLELRVRIFSFIIVIFFLCWYEVMFDVEIGVLFCCKYLVSMDVCG